MSLVNIKESKRRHSTFSATQRSFKQEDIYIVFDIKIKKKKLGVTSYFISKPYSKFRKGNEEDIERVTISIFAYKESDDKIHKFVKDLIIRKDVLLYLRNLVLENNFKPFLRWGYFKMNDDGRIYFDSVFRFKVL